MVLAPEAQRRGQFIVGVVPDGHDQPGLAGLHRHQYRRIDVLQRVPQQLASAGAVHRGPAGDWPAIVELPDDRAGAYRPVGPVMTDATDQGTGLVQLGGEVEVVEALGQGQMGREPSDQLVLPTYRLLVREHRFGILPQGAFGDRFSHRGEVGGPLVAELGREPRDRVPIARVVVVLLVPPGHPVVNGPVMRIAGIGDDRPGVRARWGVTASRVEFSQQCGEELGVVGVAPPHSLLKSVLPAPFVVTLDVLVGTVPVDQRRVPGQAHDVLTGLGLDLAAHRLEFRVGGARHGEVLPHHDPEFVAQVIQQVRLVQTPSPDAQDVHTGIDCIANAPTVVVRGQSRGEAVVRDPVRTLGQDGAPVDSQREGRTDLVRLLHRTCGAEPDAVAHCIEFGPVCITEGHLNCVQGLLTVSSRPPQGGPLDTYRARRVTAAPRYVDDVRRDRSAVGVLDLDDHVSGRRIRCAGLLETEREGDKTIVALDGDLWPHRPQPRTGPLLQADGSCDTAGDEDRPPVPPEVAGHLPDRVVGQIVADLRHVTEDLDVLPGDPQRGCEQDLERVLPLHQEVLDIEPP